MKFSNYFKENCDIGQKKELENKDFLESKFGKLIHHINNRFALFDFENDEYLIEFKARFDMNHNTFDEIMMAKQKLKHAKKHNHKTVLWIFKYDDGMFFIDVNKTVAYLEKLPVICTKTKFGDRYNIHIPNNILIPL